MATQAIPTNQLTKQPTQPQKTIEEKEKPEVINPEFVNDEETDRQLTVRSGSTLDTLAAKLEAGIAIFDARIRILRTARSAAISMTTPEDWLLFRDPEGRETGYLQDSGCQRVRQILGIDIYNISIPEKQSLPGAHGQSGGFTYIIRGDGKSGLTGETVEAVEGGRSSIDDFITRAKPQPVGAQLELLVRKAARANLDGNVTRKLAGLNRVPLSEILDNIHGDRDKNRKRMFEGRGYGSASQRGGAPVRSEWTKELPTCSVCNKPMRHIPANPEKGYDAFFGCASKCKDKQGRNTSMKVAEWEEVLAQGEQDDTTNS